MAVRNVFIQASLATILAYVMQCAHLPRKILDGLDRVNKNFLWGTSEATRKVHWVGWHKVTKPKDRGGLGLQIARGRNIALLAKLNWRLYNEKDALREKVLDAKYCTRRRWNSSNANGLPSSRIWVAIKKGREVFMKGSRWMVGKDSKISFWYGNWTKKGPIRQLIQGPLTQEALTLEIKNVIQDLGWNWSKLSFDFPLDCKLMLQAIPISFLGRGCDRLAWVENPKGIFYLKSAYGIAMGDDTSMPFNAYWIWKLKTLPRIQFFLW